MLVQHPPTEGGWAPDEPRLHLAPKVQIAHLTLSIVYYNNDFRKAVAPSAT